MVYFNCDACGESLKKNQVEKHRYKCRNCYILSCVDCGHDFRDNEYEAHIKCITEEEKYSGKNFKPKPGANKGEVKQELWTQQIQHAIDKASDPKLQNILQQLRGYPNIPRKKAKFENFLSNSLHLRNTALISKVWEAISVEMLNKDCEDSEASSANNAAVPDTEPTEQNGHTHGMETRDLSSSTAGDERKLKKRKKDKSHKIHLTENSSKDVEPDISAATSLTKSEAKKKKKKKHRDMEMNVDCENGEKKTLAVEDGGRKDKKSTKKCKLNNVQNTDESGGVHNTSEDACKQTKTADVNSVAEDRVTDMVVHCGKFKWQAVIIDVLQRAPDKQLPVKRLRKMVISEFNGQGGDRKVNTKEKLIAKFMHKVKKCPQLKVRKDIVSLVAE